MRNVAESRIVIEVELLTGRYHAHVWGEAQFAMAGPEWPPSPWRFLRALASAWFGARPSPSSDAERDALLEALGCCSAPEIWLPATTFRELRFYQPLGADRRRALHHDFFAVPRGGRFYFVFDVRLSREQQLLLTGLLDRLRYFGRAESRARLRVRDDLREPPRGFHRALPRELAEKNGEWTLRRVLCPSSSREFRTTDLWAPRPASASSQRRRRAKAGGLQGGFPIHLVDALLEARKPVPDGAQWIEYVQPAASIVQELPLSRPPVAPSTVLPGIDAILFRLSRRMPIPLGEVVAVARAFRDAAVQGYVNAIGAHSPTLTGRDENGAVLRGHRHLYYLPQPDIRGPEVLSLLVRVPPGTQLLREEMDALLSVDRIWLGSERRYPITVLAEHTYGQALVAARAWRSITPFVPPRHYRLSRPETLPEAQLAECLTESESCGTRPVTATAVRGPAGLGKMTAVRAHQYGHGAGARLAPRLTRRTGQWFRVEFDKPVVVPAPVGADSHFGLGQFVPEQDVP